MSTIQLYKPRSLTQEEVEDWRNYLLSCVNPKILDPKITNENKNEFIHFPIFAYDLSTDMIIDGVIVDHLEKFGSIKQNDKLIFDRTQNETLDDFFDLIPTPQNDTDNYNDFRKFMTFREDQLLSLWIYRIDHDPIIDKVKDAVKNIDETITKLHDADPDYGDESLIADASELKLTISSEWNNIILGKRTGDFDHDMQIDLQKQDYYSTDVYDRAYEVKDMIEKLLEAKYLSPTQVVIPENTELGIPNCDYRELYSEIHSPNNYGKQSCRLLLSMTKLMGRCLHKVVSFDEVETIETEIPQSANIQDA